MSANPAGPVGPEGVTVAHVREENEQCIDLVDWSKNCMLIGLKPDGEVPCPWEIGTEEDFRLLAALLLKPLTIFSAKGELIQSPPLATNSEFLRKLGKMAEAAARFESRRSLRSAT